MSITFRNNGKLLDFADDYYKIREFLVKLNNPNYLPGRWDWMITHLWLDKTGLPKIGIWEDNGELVAVAMYDCSLGNAYFCVYSEYSFLKKEMLIYAKDNLNKEGSFFALISDQDSYFQNIACELGFIPTSDGEYDIVYPINLDSISYKLPDGFRITSHDKEHQLIKSKTILPPEKDIEDWSRMFLRPNVNLSLKIEVVAPNGDYVSGCGMWYDKGTEYALVEPVGTRDEYQRMGLAKAAVFEGIKRCGAIGAKKAVVCSNLQFYYSIGFRPCFKSTWWKMK